MNIRPFSSVFGKLSIGVVLLDGANNAASAMASFRS